MLSFNPNEISHETLSLNGRLTEGGKWAEPRAGRSTIVWTAPGSSCPPRVMPSISRYFCRLKGKSHEKIFMFLKILETKTVKTVLYEGVGAQNL